MAFGVVLFTLLVQATTLRPLINRLGIITLKESQIEYEKRHARLTVLRASEQHLKERYQSGLVSAHTWHIMRPKLQQQNALLSDSLREILREEPALEAEEIATARREILRSQRSSLMGLRRDGVISEEVFENLATEVDAMLEDTSNPFWFVSPDSLPDRLRNGIQGQVEVEDLVIDADAPCEGKVIKDVPWPHNLIVASLRRGDEVIIPRGSTQLETGDVLTVVADSTGILRARELCSAGLANDLDE